MADPEKPLAGLGVSVVVAGARCAAMAVSRILLFAFGAALPLPTAFAGYADLSKGRPPAVLDARVGANVRLGDDPAGLPANQRGQVEPHIVRSVASPNVLLATFQEGRYFDAGAIACGYALSRDGGLTWTRALTPALTTVTGGRFNRATDPVAGAGPQGELYLQALASLQGAFSLAAVVVSRSLDGGETWAPPATVFQATSGNAAPDKNWLAVNDYAGTPTAGRLVSTWTQFIRNNAGTVVGTPLLASFSDDRGATWSAPADITPPGSANQGSQPVFLPDGSLAVVYITFLDTGNVSVFSIQCKRSTDGGRTFPAAATTVVPLVIGWDDPQLRDGVFLPNATVARQSGELFVTYTGLVGDTPRVLVVRSADGGATWSAPVAASDQPAGRSVMNPAIAATPDGRTVSVVFTDKRLAPEGRDSVDHYAALSFDGGATWQPNVRLSEMSSEIRYGPATARGVMLGDYIAIAPAAGDDYPCVAIWCETRTGDADPWTVRFAPQPTADFGTWAAVNRTGISHTDDPDLDGVPSYLEYLGGTNPRVAENGTDLVVVKSSEILEVFWTQRVSPSGPFGAGGVSATSVATYLAGGFPFLPTRISTLAEDKMPRVDPGDGLVWRGTTIDRLTTAGTAIRKSYRYSAGLPPALSRVATTADTDARLVNLSTRGTTRPGDGQLIVGFVLDGPKTVLLRAAGPALAAFGVGGALADPRLTLLAPASDLERTNDTWDAAGSGASTALFTRLGAFPFALSGRDAALALPLGAQAYTALVAGADAATGIALVEAYDADPAPGAPGNPRLINLSTRGDVGAGDRALIAGFVLSGTQPRRVLIRAVGPGLMPLGVPGPLADPVLALYRGSALVAANDDWQISRSPAVVAATAALVGAFPLPAASLDAALLLTLEPGAYTAIVTSADGTVGLALVEIYDAD